MSSILYIADDVSNTHVVRYTDMLYKSSYLMVNGKVCR